MSRFVLDREVISKMTAWFPWVKVDVSAKVDVDAGSFWRLFELPRAGVRSNWLLKWAGPLSGSKWTLSGRKA
jgi:hypothetical protein